MVLGNKIKKNIDLCFEFFVILAYNNFCGILASSIEETEQQNKNIRKLPEVNGDAFYYFGFGSNMLGKRIHIQNPTARRIGAVKLVDYKLDFFGFTSRWKGAPATIVPEKNAVTYGTLWTIDLSNLRDIDNQEGVFEHVYAPIRVQVELLSNGTIFPARAYHLVEQPVDDLKSFNNDNVPYDRQPSKTYMQCLVKGAIETGLPTAYITWLQSVKHNNCVAPDLEDFLELKYVQLST